MLAFKGRHSMKQYRPCKPSPLDSSFGLCVIPKLAILIVDFDVYYGAQDRAEVGLTTDVVLKLVNPSPWDAALVLLVVS